MTDPAFCMIPADVRSYTLLGHRHHGYGFGRGEPVGFVVAAGVVTRLGGVAVEEGDGAEHFEAGTWLTWRNMGKKHYKPEKPPKS